METSVFKTLSEINCNEWAENKNGLKYMPWAWAWSKVKEHYPLAYYTIYEAEGGRPYFTDGRTCWVKTGVTINGIEHIEDLPVMDFKNNSILLDKVTSYDVNKAIQRSLTKACARHGLGLYIYAGEDLPEEESAKAPEQKTAPAAKKAPVAPPPGAPEYKAPEKFVCNHCGKVLTPYKDANGKDISIRQHAAGSEKKFGQVLCLDCIRQLYPDAVKK